MDYSIINEQLLYSFKKMNNLKKEINCFKYDNNKILISIIIPTHNASGSIKRTLQSVTDGMYSKKFEVIVIDDCSNDNTVEIVKEFTVKHKNVDIIIMEKNSGSPSIPRNIGIEKARGEYITFLDDDDTIEPDKLYKAAIYALENSLDYLKGYMKIIKNSGINDVCRLDVTLINENNIIGEYIAKTSTNICMIVKRDFIIQNNINFDGKFKVGEDTVFTTEIFSYNPRVGYIDDYFYIYNRKSNINNVSSTQNYSDKELNDHIEVWKRAEENLNKINLSYFQLRLPVAIKNTLTSIVSYSKMNISEEIFFKFSNFIIENREYIIGKINLHKRFQDVLNSIISGDYNMFLEVTKRRLLICGYDLKFIMPIVNYIKKDYNIKIDEWTGHNTHNKNLSNELLNWADIIFCEWMLGNAVWYSNRKMNFQTLIVRAHRFEVEREFGFDLNMKNVDAVITVSYYYTELFSKRFIIPKSKMNLISNYVDENIYNGKKNRDTRYNIGIAGIIPSRKGFYKGLELLKSLRSENDKFRLIIIGTDHKNVEWLNKNPKEKEYFKQCDEFIENNSLADYVEFTGFVDRNEMFNKVDYILSLSDSEIPESFHLAPAEALVDNTAALILKWNGVEYIYPKDMVLSSLEEIKLFVLKLCDDRKLYNDFVKENKEFVLQNYNIHDFLSRFNLVIEKALLSK